MHEVLADRSAASFDGRVLELFTLTDSRRIHVGHVTEIVVSDGGIFSGGQPTLDVRTAQGRMAVNFPGEHRADLEALVADVRRAAAQGTA